MTDINNDSFANGFKRIYEDDEAFKNEQNLKTPFLSIFSESSDKLSEQGTFTAQIVAGDESGGASFSNGTFDESGAPTIINPKIMPRYLRYPLTVNKATMELSQNNKAAFGQAMDVGVRDRKLRALADEDRQAMGIGTGQITLVNGSISGSTSLVVDDAINFRRGMKIDVITALGGSGTKEINSVAITAVNLSTKTLTLASAQTCTDNSIVCKAGKCDGVSSIDTAKEIVGFRGICDTTTYSTTFENVSVSANPEWVGNVVSAGGPISQDYLQQIANRIAIYSGDMPDYLCSGLGQTRNFLNTEYQKTRYADANIKSGNVELKWGKFSWKEIWNFPTGEVALINTKNIQKYQTGEMTLTKIPGSGSWYQVQQQDVIGSYFKHIMNLGIRRARNSQGRITDLTEPTL